MTLREQIARALYVSDADSPQSREAHPWEVEGAALQEVYLKNADAVLPFIEAAWEQAATIATQDSMGVTLMDVNQFGVVDQTGKRIAFNIRAAAHKETS